MIGAPEAARPLDIPAAAVRRIPPWAGWLACCLLLALLPFVTAPGDIIADSKLDLAVTNGSRARSRQQAAQPALGGIRRRAAAAGMSSGRAAAGARITVRDVPGRS